MPLHPGLNKTLALPGASLNESAEVLRKNGNWYARVSVSVLVKEPAPRTPSGRRFGDNRAACLKQHAEHFPP